MFQIIYQNDCPHPILKSYSKFIFIIMHFSSWSKSQWNLKGIFYKVNRTIWKEKVSIVLLRQNVMLLSPIKSAIIYFYLSNLFLYLLPVALFYKKLTWTFSLSKKYFKYRCHLRLLIKYYNIFLIYNWMLFIKICNRLLLNTKREKYRLVRIIFLLMWN